MKDDWMRDEPIALDSPPSKLIKRARDLNVYKCANIAEGFVRQRYSTPEFARFLLIAEASVEEVCVWLEYARDLGYITKENFEEWDQEYLTIQAMLSKFRKSLQ